jgi:hypothetical protein
LSSLCRYCWSPGGQWPTAILVANPCDAWLCPFLIHKKKYSYLQYILRGFLRPWKKPVFSEESAAHPVWCDSSLQIGMAFWRTSNLKKLCKTAITICRGPSHLPEHSANWLRAGGP